MVGQDNTQTTHAAEPAAAAGKTSKEVAEYVLNLLSGLATMSDMAGHTQLASDIEDVLSGHSVEDY
ncbi:hypothetical protein [Litorimonas sp. WD9-15]|uniref:hypothetical protein n=1 Tax=Litorimonas sp. WD9-15 TaxID=3418716 RepID=UPI003D0063CA